MVRKTIFDPKYRAMINSLKTLRVQHGLTQRDLAKRLGVAHCFVGRAETCERRLDIMDLVRILRAMDFTDHEILRFFEKLL
ncbi:MAG: helix-turn-helix domain-containing protein [Alphaproteobacteria bacterium]|nr:helix-turn-helix domain-containing protein [Alphaproteobacteria bacterium]